MIIRLLKKSKWMVIIILILIVIEPSINSVLNFWLQRLFNAANPGTDIEIILRLMTIGFLLWLAKRIIIFYTAVFKDYFICSLKEKVRYDAFFNLIDLNIANVVGSHSTGDYISVFTNDIHLIEQRYFEQVVALCSNLFSILILGSSFFLLNKKLAIAIMSFGVVIMFVPIVFSKKLNIKNLEYSDSISELTQSIKEYLSAYPTIKNYSIESIILKKFHKKNGMTENAKFEADYVLSLADNVGSMLSWFMQLVCVGLGLVLVIKGQILLGTVIAARSFASDLAGPLQNIIINANSIRSVHDIVKKIENLCLKNEDSLLEEKDTIYPEFNGKWDLTFDDLSIEVENKTILNHFSFSFETGKKYLIIGRNGAGKSSIFKAVKRWFKGVGNSIYINNVAIENMNNSEVSKVVSYLNENISIFSGSVKDNITLFRDYSEETFEYAVTNAQVKLPLDRVLTDEGRNISSGEKRRIEIARSLLDSPKILVFDEVVSTLDIETAYEIENLALNLDGLTIIFISHNFSGKLIREYDEILLMDNGKLIDHGSYDVLLETSDYFKSLCHIKFGN